MQTEGALHRAFQVVLPRANAAGAKLGFSTPAYARVVSRDYDSMLSIARDCCPPRVALNEFATSMMEENLASTTSAWDRVEIAAADERALQLVAYVMALPAPLRDVVAARASGLRWGAVRRRMPGRAAFSLQDDYETALRRIWAEADDLVEPRRLAA